MAKDREPRSFLWLPSPNFRCFEQKYAPVHLAGQQIIILSTKIKICHPKKRQQLSNSPKAPLKSNFLLVGKRFATWHLIFEHIFKYFQITHRKLFSNLLVYTGYSMEFFSLIPVLCTAVTSHPVPLHLSHCCCEFPPKLLPSSCVSSWKFPLSLPKPSVSPFPLKGSRNIHLWAAPALAGKMRWKKSDPCGKTFCCCKVCTFFGGLAFINQCLSLWVL